MSLSPPKSPVNDLMLHFSDLGHCDQRKTYEQMTKQDYAGTFLKVDKKEQE